MNTPSTQCLTLNIDIEYDENVTNFLTLNNEDLDPTPLGWGWPLPKNLNPYVFCVLILALKTRNYSQVALFFKPKSGEKVFLH